MSATTVEIYKSIVSGNRLFMGEILSDVIERQVVEIEDGSFAISPIEHPFAVIVSQDCDLEQDARARTDNTLDERGRANALVPHILMLMAADVQDARKRAVSSRQWERVKQNKDERFHFLSAVPSNCDSGGSGVPSLVIDFKRFWSVPTEQLLSRLARGEGRCRARLVTPYAEHLAVRFGFFLQRVGLDKEHHDAESGPPGTAAPQALASAQDVKTESKPDLVG